MSTTTVLPFMGGEMGSFDPSDAVAQESTDAGSYRTAFARCSIAMADGYSYISTPVWSAASTFWFHCQLNIVGGGNPLSNGLIFFNGGTAVARVDLGKAGGSGIQLQLYTLQSGTMTSVGSVTIGSTLTPIDVNIVAGASGSAAVYAAGTKVISSTSPLNHSSFPGVTGMQLWSSGSNGGLIPTTYYSEVICDSVPHIGDTLRTYPIDTLSAVNTGFSGAVSDVDELVYNDATVNSATSAGLVSTYYASTLSLGTYNVLGVGVGARTRAGVGGPQNLQLAVRVGGTNYFSGTIALAVGYQACAASWTQNPASSVPWTPSTAAALEGGQKSIT